MTRRPSCAIHREALAGRLAHLQGQAEAQRPLPYFVEALFDYSAAMVQAELAWVERFLSQLEERQGGDDA